MTTTSLKPMTLPALPLLSDSLAAYMNAVSALPLLSEAEERELAVRLREHNDTEAARRLVMANLRLVVSVSRGYSGYGLNQGDLIQEGNIGLLKAVRKFDPARGARLATFAMYWIKAEIHEFIISNWRIVKIATTKAQRKLFFSKNRLLKNHTAEDNAVIARDLNVQVKEVEEMRDRLHNTDAVALSADDGDSDSVGADIYLTDQSQAGDTEQLIEDRRRYQLLEQALETLGGRESEILKARRLEDPPQTLQALANQHGVSIERVRQIENAALKKVAVFVQGQEAPAASCA